jgi:hypothetical protein
VGECSGSLRQASCKVIPLEEREEWALGQVSASYSVLQPSAISLTASSNFITEGSTITLYGQLSPGMIDKSITIYFKTGGSPLDVLAVVKTDLNGKFFLQLECKGNWEFSISGQSWPGDNGYAGQTANSGINRNVWILCSYYHSGSSHSLLATSREF